MSYKQEIQLRYSDSDQMGVVYHANYFSFFEQGRIKMLKEFGIDYYEIEQKGFIFPVRDVSCTYLKSIRLGEKIICETKMIRMTKVRMDFEHILYNGDNEVKAKGNTSIICVRRSDFSISKLDSNLPNVYKLKDQLEL